VIPERRIPGRRKSYPGGSQGCSQLERERLLEEVGTLAEDTAHTKGKKGVFHLEGHRPFRVVLGGLSAEIHSGGRDGKKRETIYGVGSYMPWKRGVRLRCISMKENSRRESKHWREATSSPPSAGKLSNLTLAKNLVDSKKCEG